MTDTQDIAKQCGEPDEQGRYSNQLCFVPNEELETFRTLCVAEEHKRLMALGMEPVKIEVTDQYGDAYGYTADQLAAAKLQGAEEAMREAHLNRVAAHSVYEQRIADLEIAVRNAEDIYVENRKYLALVSKLEAQLAQYKADARKLGVLATGFMLDCNCIGKEAATENLIHAIKDAARKEDV